MRQLVRNRSTDSLSNCKDVTIATGRPDGAPQATVVSFLHDGSLIFFGCGSGSQRPQNIAHDRRVSITVEAPYADWMHIQGLSLGAASEVKSPYKMDSVTKLMPGRYPQAVNTPQPRPLSLKLFRYSARDPRWHRSSGQLRRLMPLRLYEGIGSSPRSNGCPCGLSVLHQGIVQPCNSTVSRRPSQCKLQHGAGEMLKQRYLGIFSGDYIRNVLGGSFLDWRGQAPARDGDASRRCLREAGAHTRRKRRARRADGAHARRDGGSLFARNSTDLARRADHRRDKSTQDYLLYAREFDQQFPGFETDIHGLRFEPVAGGGRRHLIDYVASGAE